MKLRESLLKASTDVKKAIKVPFQVRKDKKKLESWIIDIESEIADMELKIQELKSDENLDVDKILDTIDELELKKRRLKQGNELIKELFEKEVN